MKKIPKSKDVDRGLKAAVKAIKSSLKELNQDAAKLISRGNYSAADEIVSVARTVTAFQNDLDNVRNRWRVVQLESTGATTAGPTALWKFYAPTLRILMSLGGSATRKDIETSIGSTSNTSVPEVDVTTLRGHPSWKNMLQRCLYRMAKEGFVDRDRKYWRITPSGRTASETKITEETTT